MTYARYAIYFTAKPGSALASRGAAWLGWDIAKGRAVEHPDLPDLPEPAAEVTSTPRRYGFHGTFKPPFRLAQDASEAGLREALARFADVHSAPELDGLSVARLGGFVALTPKAPNTSLHALAAAIVTEFDKFRAPASEAELAKRRAGGLTPAQDRNLIAWGYPFVLGEFRFHMTLSGRMEAAAAQDMVAALTPYFSPALPEPFPIDAVTLCGERPDGTFEALDRFSLR